MIDINSKIREFRKKEGISLQVLSEQCGYSKGYLSRIERSKDAPRIAVLQSIANALKIPITEFFESNPAPKQVSKNLDLVKKKDRPNQEVLSSSAGYYYEPLVTSSKNKFMTPFLLKVRKGKSAVFTHDSEEFIFVIRGPVDFFYEGKKYELETGDSIYFDSRLEHSFQNKTAEYVVLLFIKYDYRRF